MPEDEDLADAGILSVFRRDGASEGPKLPMMTYGAKKGKKEREIERASERVSARTERTEPREEGRGSSN